MHADRLENMVSGWFVGDFEPSILRTGAFEVAVQRYPEGAAEPAHVHRIATEITIVVSGRARMVDRDLVPGDIVRIDPGEATSFEALTDVVTVVVKAPSVIGDKDLAPIRPQ